MPLCETPTIPQGSAKTITQVTTCIQMLRAIRRLRMLSIYRRSSATTSNVV
jgi:hypothetical protein